MVTQIHLVQLPHKSKLNGESFVNLKSNKISHKKNHEPILSFIKFVCFPIHPIPAFSAQNFSIKGDVSTHTL